MKKNIGILGSGIVGQTLAEGFVKYGYPVVIGTGHPEKLAAWQEKVGNKVLVGSFNEATKSADIIVLAVKGSVAKNVLEQCGLHNLKGKVVIDATNPISEDPPVNGVLKFFTTLNTSLMEQLQNSFRESHFVKAFNSVGAHLMVNPDFGEEKPTMFICGNSVEAKAEVKDILDQFGWETEDVGKDEAARAIEPLCILWCIPGFNHNQWDHAFRLLKK
ncbi:NAD(P)-binding domain-containing protein [Fulvivirga sp. 29W222]|uniref:NAD(P)-binding domain-containing protein n=1 Tax=Fulvivirga marina TaxID=2494733 RepID=A0A937G3A0_9BACT|nr:NAD(P)-binding domain-containing protein [Fulvivirga marina]MBL6449243.1 NAD(P)-binding domain-containing protein [Fulvivirga marina]